MHRGSKFVVARRRQVRDSSPRRTVSHGPATSTATSAPMTGTGCSPRARRATDRIGSTQTRLVPLWRSTSLAQRRATAKGWPHTFLQPTPFPSPDTLTSVQDNIYKHDYPRRTRTERTIDLEAEQFVSPRARARGRPLPMLRVYRDLVF